MTKWFVVPVMVVAVAGVSGGCATKKYVKTSVGEVNTKVDDLSKSVEENQEEIKEQGQRIAQVDDKAGAAGRSAEEAKAAASVANERAATADARADAVDRASRRLVYEVVLSEDHGEFRFGKTDLPPTARTALDNLIGQLTSDPKGVYFEIEGHTDSAGAKTINEQLGLKRAEAVKRYLYEQHKIPLHKMNVISYGEEKPAAPNKTRDGRAQNRRVVIKVLA